MLDAAELENIAPAAKEVFIRVYRERKNPEYQARASEIKALIIQQIIPYKPEAPVVSGPMIEAFSADRATVEKGGTLRLQWKVTNADIIELYKNGAFNCRFTAGETSVTKTAFYDGGSRTISYKLMAYNNGRQAESNPIAITFKDQTYIPDPGKNNKSPIATYMKLGAQLVLVLVAGALIARFWPTHPAEKPVVSGIYPAIVHFNRHTVTILGKNLPINKADVKVILNNVPAIIERQSADSLAASFPGNADPSFWKDSVKVGVIIHKDTFYTPQSLFVIKKTITPKQRIACTAVPLKDKMPDGKALYTFTLAVTDPVLANQLEKVDYYFDDPSYHPKLKSLKDSRNNFSLSHRGWACFDMVDIYLHCKGNRTTDTVRFPMCAEMKITSPDK